MKNIFIVFCCLLIFFSKAFAQKQVWSDSFRTTATPAGIWQDILKLHDPLLNISPLPAVRSITKRNINLLDGEGKKGYWLEGNLVHRFVIARWNEQHRKSFQRMRFTFDAGITPRMTSDYSSPLLPGNNRFGIGYDLLLHKIDKMMNAKKPDYWLTAQIHHYSNGQSGSFFLDTTAKRNNYRSGDFSTNYMRIMFMTGRRNKKDNFYSGGLGFQREINIGGPLVLSDELKNYYGRSRVQLSFQYIRHPQTKKKEFKNKSGDPGFDKVSPKRWMIFYRTEMDYILDNVSLYPYSSKYRFGWHNYFCYFFNTDNELGLMAHTFLGRDYLNIRFDDPVLILQAGIVIRPVRN